MKRKVLTMWAAFLAGWGSMGFAQSVYPGQEVQCEDVRADGCRVFRPAGRAPASQPLP